MNDAEWAAALGAALNLLARQARRDGKVLDPDYFDRGRQLLQDARTRTETQTDAPSGCSCDRGAVPDSLTVTRGEAALILRISLRTIDSMLADGRLHRIDLGIRRARILRSEVLALLAAGNWRDQVVTKSTGPGQQAPARLSRPVEVMSPPAESPRLPARPGPVHQQRGRQ